MIILFICLQRYEKKYNKCQFAGNYHGNYMLKKLS